MSVKVQSVRASFNRLQRSVLSLGGLERTIWNFQYSRGAWLEKERSPFVIELISRYCKGGKLIEFGCGSGLLPTLLPPGTFSSYTGIDISDVAIGLAEQRCLPHCEFKPGRMEDWKGDKSVSLVVAEEVIYYLTPENQERFLRCCRESLHSSGAMLIVVHDSNKHAETLDRCRRAGVIVSEDIRGRRVYLTLRKDIIR
jgi:trans-aconitate methyltransferase